MELQTCFFTSLALLLLLLLLPTLTQAITPPPEAFPPSPEAFSPPPEVIPPTQPTAPAGTINRITKQQILVTIPPSTNENSLPFLTSPSGRYTGYLLRRETALGAGGFGNDFCYVQIVDASSSGQSVWESDCAPVSNVNACTLVFDDSGLEVFDGSRSTWSANANGNNLETLELVDEGDMRIRDQNGDVQWKASDQPQANQQCGSPGSPGLAPAKPPFASPIEGNANLPFGQQGNQQQQQPLGFGGQQQQQPGNGFGQAYGVNGQQPLVDNTPFDSGCGRTVDRLFGLALAGLLAAAASCGFLQI